MKHLPIEWVRKILVTLELLNPEIMRKLLLLTCLITAFAIRAAEPIYLIITTKDDKETALVLAEKPIITFSERDIEISSTSSQINFPVDFLKSFAYSEQPAYVENLLADSEEISFTDEKIIFGSLPANSSIMIFNLAGETIFSKNLPSGGYFEYRLNDLIPAVYLVKVNNLTYKIVKK